MRPAPNQNVVLIGGDPFDREQYSAALAAGGVDGFDLRLSFKIIFLFNRKSFFTQQYLHKFATFV